MGCACAPYFLLLLKIEIVLVALHEEAEHCVEHGRVFHALQHILLVIFAGGEHLEDHRVHHVGFIIHREKHGVFAAFVGHDVEDLEIQPITMPTASEAAMP